MSTNYLDNYYARLGISKTASFEEVRSAFRRAARQLHPDAASGAEANDLFLQIQEAYEVLADPEKRTRYDAALPNDIDGPPALMINTIYSRSRVAPDGSPQIIHVLLDLMAAPRRDRELSQRPPLNLCLILDTSTSMAGARLSRVLKAANRFIGKLQSYDVFSVVVFNDHAEVLIPASSGQDSQRLISRISALKTRGGTEILKGLQSGLGEVRRKLSPSFVNHAILITDGRTYGDEAACLALAEEAADQGITLSAIGIGAEWNEEFVDALVSRTGGSSIYIERDADVDQLLETKLSTLDQTYANNVKLRYDLGAEARLHYAFRLSPEPGIISTQSPIHAGGIPLGSSLSMLLEFEAGAPDRKAEEVELAIGELQLDIPTQPIPTTRTRFRLSRPVGELEGSEAPPQVLVRAIGQLALYRMQERARTRIRDGEREPAAKDMRMLATRLLSSGNKGLAKTVLLAAEEIKEGRALDEKSGKQIKYGTRALIQEPSREPR